MRFSSSTTPNNASFIARALLTLACVIAPQSLFAADTVSAPDLASLAPVMNTAEGFVAAFAAPLDYLTNAAADYAHFTARVGKTIAKNITDAAHASADLYRNEYAFITASAQRIPAALDHLAPRTQTASVYDSISTFWDSALAPFFPAPAVSGSPVPPPPAIPVPPAFGSKASKLRSSPGEPAPALITRTVTQPVVQHTVERVLSGITATDLETKVAALRSELLAEIANSKTQSDRATNALYLAMAPMNRINNLSSVTISNPTITGASIAGYLPTTGGGLSGTLSGTGASFSGDVAGATGTYTGALTAGTLGVGTTTPADTFAVNGVTYLAQVSAPSVTANRLYNTAGNLYWNGSVIGGSVGSWTLAGGDVYRATGKVGIGTTSPYAALSVVGASDLGNSALAGYFTATSTTNSTFPYASSTALTISGTAYFPGSGIWNSFGNVGIGTTSPYTRLSVVGQTLSDSFNATSSVGYQLGGTTLLTGSAALSSTMVGFGAGTSTTGFGVFDTFVGYQSGQANISGAYNSATGYQSLFSNLSGNNNTANGTQALFSSNGSFNNAVGYQALYSNTTGNSNTAVGYQALYSNTTANANIAIGRTALYTNTTGAANSAIGNFALQFNTTGTQNVANGQYSLWLNSTGSYNVALGYQSLPNNSTGTSSVAVGYAAGYQNVTGYNNTFLGYNAGNTDGTVSTLDALSNATAIGYDAQVTRSNALILGGTGVNAVNVGIGTTSPYAALSVVGASGVVADIFTATSTTATSTFANNISIGSSASYRINGIPVLQYDNSTGFTNVGKNTNTSTGVSLGYGNTLSGPAASAVGYQNTSSNIFSSAFGYNNTASAFNTNAFGQSNYATSSAAVAFGLGNNAGGNSSIALGYLNNAYAANSIAIGAGITNTTASSLMIGPSDAAKLTILSSGYLGIGTTSPYSTLSLNGTAGQSAPLFTLASSTNAALFSVSSTGNVTINNGTVTSGSTATLLVQTTRTVGNGQGDPSIPVAAIGGAVTVTPTTDTGDYFGNYLKTTFNGATAQTGGIVGSTNYAYANSGSNITDVMGAYNYGFHGSIGGVTNLYGSKNVAQGSIFTNGTTNAYGVYAGVQGSTLHTVTNGYGVYVATLGASVDSPYGLYVQSDKSYFGGNVGIGTTSPYAALSVAGATGVVANIFDATSTTATSTFAGTVLIGGATDNGTNKLQVNGDASINGVTAGQGNGGFGNSVFGASAFSSNTTGINNTAIGAQSLYVNSTGGYNAALGVNSLFQNTTGIRNTAIGGSSLQTNSTGGYNTGIGSLSLGNNSTGTSSTAVGYQAGRSNTTGYDNTFLGTNAGYTDGTITTTATLSNATAIGYNAQVTANNALILGGTGVNAVNVGIGTTSPASTFTTVGSACISKGTGATALCSTTAGTITANVFNTAAADLAERYRTTDPTLEAGEITMLDPHTSLSVMRAAKDKDAAIFGVVSTEPGFLLGSENTLAEASTTVPIALSGRVPLKVTNEGGPIKIGDPITLSSTPGAGMKATTTNAIIGTALENFSDTHGTILAFVNVTSAKLDPTISQGTIGGNQSSFWSIDDSSGRLKYIAALDLNDFDIINVKAIRGSANKWSIDAFGRMVVEDLEVRGSATIGSPDKRTGITLYDQVTGAPYCLSVSGGAQKTTSGECGAPTAAPDPAPTVPVIESKPEPTSTPDLPASDKTTPLASVDAPVAAPKPAPAPEPTPVVTAPHEAAPAPSTTTPAPAAAEPPVIDPKPAPTPVVPSTPAPVVVPAPVPVPEINSTPIATSTSTQP